MAEKIITFSFDDGVADDKRLVALFNKYGLKSTFNLNSGDLSQGHNWTFERDGKSKVVTKENFTFRQRLYDGHEIACHTHSHPHLWEMPVEDQTAEWELDKRVLEAVAGYRIVGSALPFGGYNDDTEKALKQVGLSYCRTTRSTFAFTMPDKLPMLDPTCHFLNERIWELADAFFAAESDQPLMFYIWGHSYELVDEEDWANFEKFCAYIAHREGVKYLTNREALQI